VLFDPINRCWLSSLYNYGASLSASIDAFDNYDNFRSTPPTDPYTRGTGAYWGTVSNPGTLGTSAVAADVGSWQGGLTPVDDADAMNLTAAAPGYNDIITPRFKPQDFHHGVRIMNGATIDWAYPSAGTPDFGSCKLSICTPNQLYLQGDFNTTSRSVKMKDGTLKVKLTPVAVMGDVVTLLSNAFRDENYQIDGLTVDTRRVTGSGTAFMRPNGASATSSTYNTCILTHNLPTTKASLRFGEASSFVNTMMFIENWSGRTMTYLGSLVVMNSRRYSQAYLLEQPKVSGRTPFGWAGWNARANSGATVPEVDGTFENGTGYLDWCCLSASSKAANSVSELVPYDYPTALAAGKTIATTTDGIPPVYFQPNRNMTFNEDLLTEQGTPPFTPYGQQVRGLGAWSRVIE
jgi:hypothetical protein